MNNRLGHVTAIPVFLCPRCQEPIDRLVLVKDDSRLEDIPEPGDTIVCDCRAILEIVADGIRLKEGA